MNVLITGGTGFIGSRLALRCLNDGHAVRVFGQQNNEAERKNKDDIEREGAQVILGSMTDKDLIDKVTQGVDVVFHLAAAQHEANVPDHVFSDVNVTGTKNLLDMCLKAGVKRFVHGSTIGVYGNFDGRIDEESPCNPENIYGVTKLEGEKLVLSYKDKIPLVIIRISETYGPGDRRLLKLFKLINKNAFFMIGSGKNLHQLIFVDDLISGLLNAADSEKAVGEIILLVGKEPITTNDMVKTIADSLNARILGFRAPRLPFLVLAWMMETCLKPLGIQPPLHRRRMDFFRKSFSFSSKKAPELLSFKPKFSFELGVTETARWYKKMGLLSDQGGQKPDKGQVKLKIDTDLTAQIEPFDTFWEAPEDIEKGYAKFAKFYKRNYFKYMPENKNIRTLVVSCGAGYFIELMQNEGYTNVLGIDSDPAKVEYTQKHGLNCKVENAFPFLRNNQEPFDLIFAEQEINHLTKDEILIFLDLCRENLKEGGTLFVHSLNGANPITGAEALAQNFNHFNTFTEYSLRQVLSHAEFKDIKVFPLNLYIFYENPVNYVGMFLNAMFNTIFRIGFIFYGKENKIFSKKIAAVCKKDSTQ
ncbi:MAG: NAD-dependent epimerase/dehydratase family protein [Deltaproteobacteria bacterium]|nr:NAD-dependent epimerase/dehydratase family protein [Deltaproteobacteria bacterium]